MIVYAIIAAVLAFIGGFSAGILCCESFWQKKLIELGIGEWFVNPKTGSLRFIIVKRFSPQPQSEASDDE